MKRLLVIFMTAVLAWCSSKAMSYEEARDRAWFLTDKMAYELNLTPEQYDRAYQVNLDYLMSVRTASDIYSHGWRYRDADLRCILFDWQYKLYTSLDYFFRPLRWVHAAWHYPICDHYRRGYYYFHRPTVYISYRGGMWHRRGHNDVSPYRRMRFSQGHGMRDRYHSNDQRPIHRPEYGRPARPNRPDGERHEYDHGKRPNTGNGNRYNRGNRENNGERHNPGKVSRPSRGNNRERGQSQRSPSQNRSSHNSRRFGR